MEMLTPSATAEAIEHSGRILGFFLHRDDAPQLLRETHVDWAAGSILKAPPQVVEVLRQTAGCEADQRTLTTSGLRILGRLQINLESAARSSRLSDHFEIIGPIAKGSSSVALKAINKRVGRTIVLKLLQSSKPELVEAAIKRLGAVDGIPHLVAPMDSYTIPATSIAEDPVELYCIVFPFIDGTTLDDYLFKRPPVTPFYFEAFVRQVGGVLRDLEMRGMTHGDLHGRNILVSSEDPNLEFTVIDPSHGLTSASPYTRQRSDFEWFKEHLAVALFGLRHHLASISIQRHLGPRLFSIINRILQADRMTFREVFGLLEDDPFYAQWLRDRTEFISTKFKQPMPLGLLRWEEIADPAQALDLFEPFPGLFRQVRAFGNSLIVGPRGSGKSTYLAALAYFPAAKKRLVEPTEVFGVLFSCRQGEFKQISHDFIRFDAASRIAVKHILALKIIRRVLAILSSASGLGELASSGDMTHLYEFVRSHVPGEASIPRVSASPTAELSNLAAGVVRWEELEMRRLFATSDASRNIAPRHLNEASLLKFCELVRGVFPALASSRFYFLFDDAGEPNIPRDAQHVLNDFVASSNSVYCIKLSAERYSYELSDSVDRTLEETHDFTSFDISSAYATEGGVDHSRTAVRNYFAKIMKKRLEFWKYPETNIAKYLAFENKPVREMGPVPELIRLLADGRRNAYYAGWEVVWRLADKTPRNLIELVSEIFAQGGVRPQEHTTLDRSVRTEAISARIQDRAIKDVSSRRLRGLEFIPGEISILGEKAPLGKHLYACASAFGAVSHRYLTKHRGKSGRLSEILAIERNDTSLLSQEARNVLQLLVRYGIFDDSPLTFAFDDGQKKPICVLNRIFCPAFRISFRRDVHLRLSARKFEMYLLRPASFVKQGTAFLHGEKISDAEGTFWEVKESDG